jgi:hypothetical protein
MMISKEKRQKKCFNLEETVCDGCCHSCCIPECPDIKKWWKKIYGCDFKLSYFGHLHRWLERWRYQWWEDGGL